MFFFTDEAFGNSFHHHTGMEKKRPKEMFMESSNAQQTTQCEQLGGKYLNFMLSGEFYGLKLLEVREIIGMMKITSVPNVPAEVRGVVNLRGKVIPVLDLRQKFGMPSQEATERTCIIVMQTEASGRIVTIGIIVDEVSEVIDIPGDQIEPSPALCADTANHMIEGVGKVGNKVILLLNSDRVLAMDNVPVELIGAAPA